MKLQPLGMLALATLGCGVQSTGSPAPAYQSPPPVQHTVQKPTSSPEPAMEPKRSSQGSSSKAHKESAAEKLYEKVTGKEVVHKKDGTTYERKQAKKRK